MQYFQEYFKEDVNEYYQDVIKNRYKKDEYFIYLFQDDEVFKQLSEFYKITRDQLYNGFDIELQLGESGICNGFGIKEYGDRGGMTIDYIKIVNTFVVKNDNSTIRLKFCGLKNFIFGDPV